MEVRFFVFVSFVSSLVPSLPLLVFSLTITFQMSIHTHAPPFGSLYGTRGTPTGIMRVTRRDGPADPLPPRRTVRLADATAAVADPIQSPVDAVREGHAEATWAGGKGKGKGERVCVWPCRRPLAPSLPPLPPPRARSNHTLTGTSQPHKRPHRGRHGRSAAAGREERGKREGRQVRNRFLRLLFWVRRVVLSTRIGRRAGAQQHARETQA